MTSVDAPTQITVYTLPWCVHCACAKALLRRRGLSFREVDGSGEADFRRRIAALTGGYTVPQIVIDDEPIGGADRLARLDRLGVLEAIARHEQFPIVHEVRRISQRSLIQWVVARVRGQDGVSAFRRVRVRIDRAGRAVDTDAATDSAVKEEHDGERLCRTAR